MCTILMMTGVSMRLLDSLGISLTWLTRIHKWTYKLKQWSVCITFSMVNTIRTLRVHHAFSHEMSSLRLMLALLSLLKAVVWFLSRFNLKYSGKLWCTPNTHSHNMSMARNCFHWPIAWCVFEERTLQNHWQLTQTSRVLHYNLLQLRL